MTWGDVVGTPMLLEEGDVPPDKPGTPTFTMKAERKKERIGLRMAEEAAIKMRRRKGRAPGGMSPMMKQAISKSTPRTTPLVGDCPKPTAISLATLAVLRFISHYTSI